MITCIAAMNKYGTIGLDGSMPWHAPEDLKAFKNYTMGKTLIMGRKTFEGLPKKLVGRNILKVSRNKTDDSTITDFETYLKEHVDINEEIVVAGGGEIYKMALPYAKRLVLSYIHNNDVKGDTFFPDFNVSEFNIVKRTEYKTFTQIIYEKGQLYENRRNY